MPFSHDGGSKESAVYDTDQPLFDPYDPPETPETVQPTSPRPAPSSATAPGFGDTSGADGEQEQDAPPQGPQEEAKPAPPPLPEFDPKYRDEFTGLLYLGRLQKTFTRWGHTFVVRTLTTEDLAAIGLIILKYAGTTAYNAVYQSAYVAASVVTVDGQPLPGSITIDNSDELETVRFPYVLRNWMPAVREEVYNETFALEVTSRQVLDAMGKVSG